MAGLTGLGMGSRSIFKRAKEQPFYVTGVCHSIGSIGLIPLPGGVLIEEEAGQIIGAVGVSGDTSDNDEAAALAAIAAAGLKANPGSDDR